MTIALLELTGFERVLPVLYLALGKEIACIGKCGYPAAIGKPGVPAHVIRVQVGHDGLAHVIGGCAFETKTPSLKWRVCGATHAASASTAIAAPGRRVTSAMSTFSSFARFPRAAATDVFRPSSPRAAAGETSLAVGRFTRGA